MAHKSHNLPSEDTIDSVFVHPSAEPHTDPEKLLPEEFERKHGIYEKLGMVTEQRNLPLSDAERPIRERARRADDYHDLFYKGNTVANKIRILLGQSPIRPTVENRAEMVAQGNAPAGFDPVKRNESVKNKLERGYVMREYLKQGTIDLAFDDLGKMGATYAIVNPSPEKLQPDKPTIVLVAGLSNAAASVAQIVDQLALSGRKVVVLPQPESAVGGVNEQFAAAVKESEDFSPHARYFRALIEGLSVEQVPELQEKMELWAYSAGCPEMARALTDPEFSKKVDSAVFIAPASSADVPKVGMRAGLDFLGMLMRFKPQTPIAWGRKSPETKEENQLRSGVRDDLAKQLSKKTDLWQRMKVGDGSVNKVTVITYNKDFVTDAALGFPSQESMPNSQMKLVSLKGKHLTPTMPEGAKELLEAVNTAKMK